MKARELVKTLQAILKEQEKKFNDSTVDLDVVTATMNGCYKNNVIARQETLEFIEEMDDISTFTYNEEGHREVIVIRNG
jgi:hypothetical protein